MKRKLKKEVKIVLVVIVLILIVLISIKIVKVRSSYEFKFAKLGYNKEEIKTILTLKEEQIQRVLKGYNYQKYLANIIKDKYFIFNNVDKYLSYYDENINLSVRDVVERVNTNRNTNYYTNIKDTNISQGSSMLVNKYYTLKEYIPELVNVSSKYAYQGNKVTKETNDALEEMFDGAKKSGFNFILNGAYRDYKVQEKTYNNEKNSKGIAQADKVISRPGHSEHQTGLAFDINIYQKKFDKFEDTEEFKWLVDNSYKFGFILRYPKDKENITGYIFEPWHFRYVGKDIAKYIYENRITFEEYYAYYIENKG